MVKIFDISEEDLKAATNSADQDHGWAATNEEEEGETTRSAGTRGATPSPSPLSTTKKTGSRRRRCVEMILEGRILPSEEGSSHKARASNLQSQINPIETAS